MFGNRGFSPYGAYALGSAAKNGINWSSLLSNTQKTLGIINQAIPAFYQIKPIFSNMRTMFKVVNEINRDETKSNNSNNNYVANDFFANEATPKNDKSNNQLSSNATYQEDSPIFFV